MKQYLDLAHKVLEEGVLKPNRTGVDTIGIFGYQMRFDLSKGFPAMTTKKLAWRSVVSELLWFLEGSGDNERLKEILYGSASVQKPTIWSANAESPDWIGNAQHYGDLGRIYGVQWRHWRTPKLRPASYANYEYIPGGWEVEEVDQVENLINGLKTDPNGRRHILTAWNPGELSQMALPPCHCFSQFYVVNNTLSCQMYQRSCDLFLGVPFNIASYALLTHILAKVCGFHVGEFVHTLGDVHIYLNHYDAVKEQLTREPYPLPTLEIVKDKVANVTDFSVDDFVLKDYKHHDSIKADMAV